MMKRIRKAFLNILLAGALVISGLGAAPTEVLAADGEYTYTVTLYAGNHGTFGNGADRLTFSGLPYGAQITLNPYEATVDADSKYYIKGIRESGSDTSTEVSQVSAAVTSDMDYVVAYGIVGNQVAYTVEYVDAAGNTLADSQTLYGNVGDKPVVAYQYIEGYQPQAYNLTGTLSDNAAANVFRFTYTANPQGTNTVTYETVTAEDGTTTIVVAAPGTAAGTAGTGAAGTAGTTGTTDEAEVAETVDGTGTTGADTADDGTDQTDAIEDDQVPQGLIDLDDEEVPQGNIDVGSDSASAARERSVWPIVAGVGAGVVALCALVVLYLRIKRKRL